MSVQWCEGIEVALIIEMTDEYDSANNSTSALHMKGVSERVTQHHPGSCFRYQYFDFNSILRVRWEVGELDKE